MSELEDTNAPEPALSSGEGANVDDDEAMNIDDDNGPEASEISGTHEEALNSDNLVVYGMWMCHIHVHHVVLECPRCVSCSGYPEWDAVANKLILWWRQYRALLICSVSSSVSTRLWPWSRLGRS